MHHIFFNLLYESEHMFNANELAEKVNNLSHNSAKDIVEIGLVFYEAKEHLSERDYISFLKMTHYDQKSSMIRKWYGIGKSYQRLSTIQKRLPPVVTTIYIVATMSIDKFERLLKSDVLQNSSTTKEITDFLDPPKSRKKNSRLIIEFVTPMNDYQLKEMYDYIESTYSSFIELKMNEEFRALLDAANSKTHLFRKAA